MRNHADIIKEAGSPESVATLRGVSVHTVRSWIQRDSIPPEHWIGCVEDGWTTLEELAKSVKPRSRAA